MNEGWTIRPATPSDTAGCGRVIFEAFGAVNARHGFESRWLSADFASTFIREFASLDGIYSVVCEHEGSVIGCNFLDERGDVRGIGPTAVAPSAQGCGIGRALMANVLERAGNGKSVRLLQDSFNMGSMSLYASLGFEVKEPVTLMRGKPSEERERCSAYDRYERAISKRVRDFVTQFTASIGKGNYRTLFGSKGGCHS